MRILLITGFFILVNSSLGFGSEPGPRVPDIEQGGLEANILIGVNVVTSVFSVIDLSTGWDSKLVSMLGLASGLISIELAGGEFQVYSEALMVTGVTTVGLSIINLSTSLWRREITFQPTMIRFTSGLVPGLEFRVNLFR